MISRLPLSVCGWLAALSFQAAYSGEDPHVEGEVLVTFKQNVGDAGSRTALGRHSLEWSEHYDKISRQRGKSSGLVKGKGLSTARLIAELKADVDVETVEPNYIRHVSAIKPNDTNFSKLWGLENTGQTVNSTIGTSGADTKFLAAWNLARPSSADVVVAVADTGLDITHPDIAANVWINPGEIPGNGIDDDGNGYIDDVTGYDFASGTATMTDSGEHGTHVAGTIAAVGKNGVGVIGVDYRAKILPLKVSSDGDSLPTSAILSAFNYAIALKQKGVNIVAINASFGGSSSSTSERVATEALRDAGIVLCAAAGNDGANNDSTASYPANYATSNIISVAALTQANALASFSNYGATTVDIAAPGTNIYSTMPVSLSTVASSVTAGGTSYGAVGLEFAGSTGTGGMTGPIYSCGIGNTDQFPVGLSGYIALIQRGSLNFSTKVANAKNAGAVAAIIYDTSTDSLGTGSWTLGSSGSWIPALQVTKASGEAILAALPATGTVVNALDPSQAYQFLDGTSMATPHVTGAVAFAALNFPSETMAQRIARILNHATPVAALSGKMTTGGRLNLLGIVDTDGDGLPDWWETENFGDLTHTATGDEDGDGFTDLEEFLSNTSPLQQGSHLAFSTFGAGASGSSFQLSFPTVAERSYQVEWSDSMESGTWTALGSAVTGTGAAIQVEDSAAFTASPHRFYRLRLNTE